MHAYELFEKGRQLLKDGNSLAALACFEKAASIERIRGIRSYLGLCYALERAQTTEGIKLCHEAIDEEPENPFHYLNLGKIYIRVKRKEKAIEILRQGLSVGDCEDIRRYLDSLGTRRKPCFPFLPRKHFLNRYCGLFFKKLGID